MSEKGNNLKSVGQLVSDSYQPINTINQYLGVGIISIKGDTITPRSIYQDVYTTMMLILFLAELGYLLTNLDNIQENENIIIKLTHLFHLFAENAVSCICLINCLVYNKTEFKNILSWAKSEQILFKLGIQTGSIRNILQGYLVIACGVILPGIFLLDYKILFQDEQEKYISYRLWLFLLGHVFYNNFMVLHNTFVLKIIKDRFIMLNDTMRDLHRVAMDLTLPQRVKLVKESHDYLYSMLAYHWTPHSLVNLGELIICAVLITSYMYTIISMVIDGHYNGFLLAHCCSWVLYSGTMVLVLVISNSDVCSQVL